MGLNLNIPLPGPFSYSARLAGRRVRRARTVRGWFTRRGLIWWLVIGIWAFPLVAGAAVVLYVAVFVWALLVRLAALVAGRPSPVDESGRQPIRRRIGRYDVEDDGVDD